MADDKKQHNTLMTTLPVTAVMAILASWFFSAASPYQEERPSSRPTQSLSRPLQDVEARLWQDPFAALEGVNEANGGTNKGSHDWHYIYCTPTCNGIQQDKPITLLAVTLPGGSYQEAVEQRMRRRYAVLSALANQGAAAEDEQHLGYFEPEAPMAKPDFQAKPAQYPLAVMGEGSYQPELNMALQQKVPFEWWFLPNDLPDHKEKILLLWVDESSLFENPAKKLNKLLGEAGKGNVPQKIQYKVVGPSSSAILRDLLKEANRAGKATADPLGYVNGQAVEFFSAEATAPDEVLLKGIDDQSLSVSLFLREHNITLYRTTANDKAMMEVIVNELELRQILPEDQVVVLSEWDTLYGREMPKAFEMQWQHYAHQNNVPATRPIQYGYMRGLDGKLPDKAGGGGAGEKKVADKDKSSAEKLIELPEGQNQKDYLRRLADRLDEKDQTLKAGGNPKGIAAIGVLGSDVHDKLLVLEALRQHFPHKLFFTTDLDSLYGHPLKLPQTHNLLVASAFDLSLRPELQGKIPPFRDSYETALFLATQIVLNPASVNAAVSPPRLFEVGRKHIIALPTRQDIAIPTLSLKDNGCDWKPKHWAKCDTVQPAITVNQSNWTLKGSMAFIWVALIPLLFSWLVRNGWKTYILVVGAVLTLALIINKSWWNDYILRSDAEPFYWLEGVSGWPSQLLRLGVWLFAMVFFMWGHKRILNMQKNLQVKHLTVSDHQTLFALPDKPKAMPVLHTLFVGFWKEGTAEKFDFPDRFWKTYLGYCRTAHFSLRVLVHWILLFLTPALLIKVDIPLTPVRGDLADNLNMVIIVLAVVATTLLTLWVVENARLCERLIDNLLAKPSLWNSAAQNWAINQNKVAQECVNDWLDVQLVVQLTVAMQPLIWGPVACIVMLIFACSPIIDDWDTPWELRVAFIGMLLYAVYAEILLQRGAKRTRTKAVERLSLQVYEQRNAPKQPNEVAAKRIQSEIERICTLCEGAFRPWYELPLLQSLGGLSTLAFAVQYLADVWVKGAF